MSHPPRLIALDGPAGAGKTSVTSLLAETLRGRDIACTTIGGSHDGESSSVVRRLSDLQLDLSTRGLSPRAALGLTCAHLSQVMADVVRPALARGETVVLDGSPLAALTEACSVHGLPRDHVDASLRQALDGCLFDRIFVLDVEPATATVRRTIQRVAEDNWRCLPGAGRIPARVSACRRAGFLQLAVEGRHTIIRTERLTPAAVAQMVASALQGELSSEPADDTPYWRVPPEWGLGQALASMPAAMALYFSRGLAFSRALRREAVSELEKLVAWSLDRQDPLREQLTMLCPDYALRGVIGRPLSPRDLRVRMLDRAPRAVARSLATLSCDRSDSLRRQIANAFPGDVLASLIGRDDASAWEMRRNLWEHGDAAERAVSLIRCRSELASRYREGLLADSPVEGVVSLRGATPEQADPWLWSRAERSPCVVLAALVGRDDPTAHRLREALFDVGADVIDSVRGLTDSQSWLFRDRAVERWPDRVIRSLLGVPDSPRRASLLAAAERAGSGDVHVLRSVQLLEEHRRLPSWARAEYDVAAY